MLRIALISLLITSALVAQENKTQDTHNTPQNAVHWLTENHSTSPTHKLNRFVKDMDGTRKQIESVFQDALAYTIPLPEGTRFSAQGGMNKVDVQVSYKF